MIRTWTTGNAEHHRVNILVTPGNDGPDLHVLPRDARRSIADGKGLIGGFEVAGDFAYSDPQHRGDFETSDTATAYRVMNQISPGSPD